MSATIESTQAVQSLLRRHLATIDSRSCGRGGEPEVDGVHDDAMAWSLYGRGYVFLAERGNSEQFREAAATCVRRILELRSPVACASQCAWGLPYSWKEQPAHHPYGITTAMCGDFLLDAAAAGITPELDALQGAVTWLTEGITWRQRPGGACPEFSPKMTFLATNVAAR